LIDLNANLKVKITEEEEVEACSLNCSISRVKGCVGAPG